MRRRAPRRHSTAAIAGLVLLIVSVGCGDRAAPEGSVVARWSTFETTLDRPVTEANPFDPAEIAVDVEFVSPSGRSLTVPAFVDREYERELADEREVLRPVGDLAWRVRFTPDEEGVWAWSWRVRTASGEEARSGGRLFVGPPEGARGFVRRVGDGRALRFDDGSPFIAVGENLSWYDSRGTFAYDAWMARLAAEGCTYIRVWMPSWAFGLEWIRRDASGAVVETTLGNYAARLERAWQLDHVLELARQHGIEVMLSIQNHGAFSLAFNSEWADNPYNAVNGGPLVSPRELFTSAEARELFRRRLRYVVGRWGHAPQILAWELWNEVDLVEQPSLPDLLAWHREMAGEIDALDPWDHLISTSTGGVDSLSLLSGGETPQSRLWELDEIDFVQSHLYAIGRDAPIDFTAALPELTRRLGRFGKPILIAEAGTDFRGPAETLRADPEGDGFHDILWAGFFSGAFGSGMAWWWDNVRDPQDQYFHFGPLARLVRGVDLAGEQIGAVGADVRVDGGRALTAFVRSGRGTVLIWIKDLGHQWFAPDPIEISGAKLELRGLAAGGWIGEWLQTRSTETVAIPELHPAEGVLSIEVPTFARDIALRLERLAE